MKKILAVVAFALVAAQAHAQLVNVCRSVSNPRVVIFVPNAQICPIGTVWAGTTNI